jgi:hypothetical protein
MTAATADRRGNRLSAAVVAAPLEELPLALAVEGSTLAVAAFRRAMYVWFVVVSMYISVAGMFIHWPMGSSCGPNG